jgi:hypothetical protein
VARASSVKEWKGVRELRAAFWGENTLILQGADEKVCVMEASRAAEDDMIDNGVLVLIIRAS